MHWCGIFQYCYVPLRMGGEYGIHVFRGFTGLLCPGCSSGIFFFPFGHGPASDEAGKEPVFDGAWDCGTDASIYLGGSLRQCCYSGRVVAAAFFYQCDAVCGCASLTDDTALDIQA